MKLACLFPFLIGANGYLIRRPQQTASINTELQAKPQQWIATALLGGILAATPVPTHAASPLQSTHQLIAKGAYIPEESFSSTDLSMPSYNIENSDLPTVAPNTVTSPMAPKAANEGGSKKAARNLSAEAAADRVAAKKEEKLAAKAAAKASAQERKAAAIAERAAVVAAAKAAAE